MTRAQLEQALGIARLHNVLSGMRRDGRIHAREWGVYVAGPRPA
jgi:hypothetical protein